MKSEVDEKNRIFNSACYKISKYLRLEIDYSNSIICHVIENDEMPYRMSFYCLEYNLILQTAVLKF